MSQSEQEDCAEQPTSSSNEHNGVLVNPRAVCNACKRLYRDPKILPCLHTFCSDCIGQLEPFSVGSRRGEAVKGGRPAVAVTVLVENKLKQVYSHPGGPEALSTDHLALDDVFLETLVTDGPLGCDLCGEGGAGSRCEVCCANLCEFCCQAHRKIGRKKVSSGEPHEPDQTPAACPHQRASPEFRLPCCGTLSC